MPSRVRVVLVALDLVALDQEALALVSIMAGLSIMAGRSIMAGLSIMAVSTIVLFIIMVASTMVRRPAFTAGVVVLVDTLIIAAAGMAACGMMPTAGPTIRLRWWRPHLL